MLLSHLGGRWGEERRGEGGKGASEKRSECEGGDDTRVGEVTGDDELHAAMMTICSLRPFVPSSLRTCRSTLAVSTALLSASTCWATAAIEVV
jgi:hypothetical protein